MMIPAPLALLSAVSLPLLCGWALTRRLCRRTALPLSLTLAVGYGIGIGLLAQHMLLLGLLGIKYSVLTIGLPLLAGTLALWPGTSASSIRPWSRRPDSASLWSKAGFIVLSLFILGQEGLMFWRALSIPIRHWDGLSFIAFDAKVFFYERLWYRPADLPHPSYPLQVPFLLTWTALNLGAWHEQLVKIIFPCAFLAYLGIHYNFLRLLTTRLWALGGTAAVLASAFWTYHGTIEYRDGLMMYFNCGAILLLLLWGRLKDSGLLILAGLFSGFMTFTKLEGALYLPIHGILLAVLLHAFRKDGLKMSLGRAAAFLLPAAGLLMAYLAVKAGLGIPLTEKTGFDFIPDHLQRIPSILHRFSAELFWSGNWNILWGFLVLSLVTQGRRLFQSRELRGLITALILFLGAYALLALLTPNFQWLAGSNADAGLSRVVLHFFPLAPAALILLHAPEHSDTC